MAGHISLERAKAIADKAVDSRPSDLGRDQGRRALTISSALERMLAALGVAKLLELGNGQANAVEAFVASAT
jgi:hypothetical protein